MNKTRSATYLFLVGGGLAGYFTKLKILDKFTTARNFLYMESLRVSRKCRSNLGRAIEGSSKVVAIFRNPLEYT